jgi:hypothetical protein
MIENLAFGTSNLCALWSYSNTFRDTNVDIGINTQHFSQSDRLEITGGDHE